MIEDHSGLYQILIEAHARNRVRIEKSEVTRFAMLHKTKIKHE